MATQSPVGSIKANTIVENICQKICHSIDESATAVNSIRTVYLFGSVLDKKEFKQNSDIDLAFLIEKNLYKKDPLTASVDSYLISTDTGLRFERQTDVIILNSASLETAFQIISTGIVVYEHDLEKRIEYEIAIKGMYFDFKPFIEKLRLSAIEN